jgi:hypothetical protein
MIIKKIPFDEGYEVIKIDEFIEVLIGTGN